MDFYEIYFARLSSGLWPSSMHGVSLSRRDRRINWSRRACRVDTGPNYLKQEIRWWNEKWNLTAHSSINMIPVSQCLVESLQYNNDTRLTSRESEKMWRIDILELTLVSSWENPTRRRKRQRVCICHPGPISHLDCTAPSRRNDD